MGREVISGRVDGACKNTEAWKCKSVCEEQERLSVGKVDGG